jgi:hypothetical protein
MKRLLQGILAVLLGLVATSAVVALTEFVGFLAFPMPKGMDVSSPEAIAKNLDQIPRAALATVVVGWIVAAFVGAWVVGKVAPKSKPVHAMVFTSLFLLATMANLASFTHPLWMWVVGLGGIAPAAFAGVKLAAGPPEPAPAQSSLVA